MILPQNRGGRKEQESRRTGEQENRRTGEQGSRGPVSR
jgi:hypothetical protein